MLKLGLEWLGMIEGIAQGLFFLGMLEDFNLIIKIFVFITIISFAQNHLGKGPLTIIITAVFSFFVLFVAWPFFGSVFLLYTLLMVGVSSLLVDFFFITAGIGAASHNRPDVVGTDIAARQNAAQGGMMVRRMLGKR